MSARTCPWALAAPWLISTRIRNTSRLGSSCISSIAIHSVLLSSSSCLLHSTCHGGQRKRTADQRFPRVVHGRIKVWRAPYIAIPGPPPLISLPHAALTWVPAACSLRICGSAPSLSLAAPSDVSLLCSPPGSAATAADDPVGAARCPPTHGLVGMRGEVAQLSSWLVPYRFPLFHLQSF
jgi:hypothetical protein